MTEHTLETVSQWLEHSTAVAIDAGCRPDAVAETLRAEARRIHEVHGEDAVVRIEDNEAADHEVLARVIAGASGGTRIRYDTLELRHPGHERWTSLWAVFDTENGSFVTWLNGRSFRTTAALRDYLAELAALD